MFDIGFWELALIAVIALLVVGPERLPGLARTVGAWIGKAKRFISKVKADIDEEIRLDELRKTVTNPESELSKAVEETRNDLNSATQEINETLSPLKPDVASDEQLGTADDTDDDETNARS